jgi:pilus assembly protein FimV
MRISLALVFFLSSEVWAIGLGDINLDSALNEPLRAEIELLSATPEELANLSVTLASAETFARYGIDRPFNLQGLEFNVTSGPDGAVIQVRSRAPVTEPFLTFLVEATWSSGRLLREYTVLLDPPTYAPPAVQQAPAVEAPRRATPTDSARIDRQPAATQPEPEPAPRPQPRPTYTPPPPPAEQPAAQQPSSLDRGPYSTASGGDYFVERGDTLWGIASRMRPDDRLTMNQTMLAIFEANPQAFSGNINRLRAGASISIPSADDVFQISRSDALAEVRRQNEAWGGPAVSTPDTSYADVAPDEPAYEEPAADEPDSTTTTPVEAEPAPAETQPSLVLVPPDEEPAGAEYADELETSEAATREQEIEQRIAELEAADVPDQQSLIQIRDNELAALRQELAEIRGEVVAEPLDESLGIPSADDEIVAETDAEPATDDAAEDEAQAEAETPPASVVQTRRVSEPSIMDRVMAILGSFWTKIIAALILVAGVLLWFVRRGRGDDDETPWETLDSDEIAAGAMAATATLSAPTPEEAIVVVEQDSGIRPLDDDTLEAPMPEIADDTSTTADTGQFGSLEDTFSSETAVNLDQTDPLAEADFHMAYGLYDQAADLINGALEAEPGDQALMSKLCEIYFVWGNRDAFVDAATQLKAAVGDGESAEWDKIVIMGQQIAADHALFAGAAVAGATKAVDLSFESDMDDAGALDIDFGGDDDAGSSDIVDLGADGADDDGAIDFFFDEEVAAEPTVDEMLEATAESPTVEQPGGVDVDATAEMPAPAEPTVETPTIEQAFSSVDGTSELPSLDESLGEAIADAGQDSDATAEINLDELDLDIDGLEETEVAGLSDLDETGTNEILEDLAEITGKNPEVDPDATGVREAPDIDSAGFGDDFDFDDFGSTGTGLRLARDETGRMPLMDAESEADEVETDAAIDPDLLDATGLTQVLSDDLAVETTSDAGTDLGDDDATMLAPGYGDEDEDTEVSADAETLLAPLDDDDEDFDFAKTEALPPDVFTGETSLDETGEMPVAGTDLDLDLDDLTAALQVSDAGDTVEQLRDDATVEQPRPSVGEETAEIPTMSLSPDDMSEDLHEARTMTEVGTKLDLARAYVDMGDPAGARSILEEVLDEGDEGQRQQAQQLLDSLPS